MSTITINNRKYGSRDDETILESLLRQGVPIRHSCRRGSCGTCKTHLLSGDTANKRPIQLRKDAIGKDQILLCISRAKTDLVLDDLAIDLGKFKEIESEYEYREELKCEIPKPDLELWGALDNGKLLLKILTHFYSKVYEDERLAPFFHSTTLDRAIGKQYNFLQELITGEKIYFGSYPRTAHHWMVIDEDLFEYRESLLRESMVEFGLPEPMIRRWRALHDAFKSMIVKKHTWPKIIDGTVVPIVGFETMTAEFDMLCDSCQHEICSGESIGYHQEDAKVYCKKCADLQ